MNTIAQLKESLSTQYVLKCFTDLAQLSTSPSSAYSYFQSCYQETFNSNDRLIFYTSNVVPDKFLQQLYQASNLIDISNFFVLICSTIDISEQVNDAARLYSTDHVPFQTLQVELEDTIKIQDNFFVSDTLCPMPWMNLEVSSDGKVRPCCVYKFEVGNVKALSLNDIFYSSDITALRQELLNGKQSSGCQHCWDTENKGLISNRHYHMSMLKKELLTTNLVDLKIRNLDLKPGNTCNFKCRICSPISSSLFEQEERGRGNISIKSFNWAEDNSTTVNEILELLPTLTNIDMYGGEPFLIKPLFQIVKQAVDNGYASNMRLHYNSNGSVYPEKFIEYWKNFKHVDIHFSIDNVGSRFELERGGSWSQVDSNIRKLLELRLPNVKISIMPAISIMNIFYIDEVLQWAEGLDITVNPLYVTTPAGFNLTNLTADAKQLIVSKFKNHRWPEMQNILTYILSIPDSTGEEFVKLCRHFDSIRNQNFENTHLEIAKSMGYVYNKNL
jgi:radical SAM protein with 4Fe4S-binding SPASM domain